MASESAKDHAGRRTQAHDEAMIVVSNHAVERQLSRAGPHGLRLSSGLVQAEPVLLNRLAVRVASAVGEVQSLLCVASSGVGSRACQI